MCKKWVLLLAVLLLLVPFTAFAQEELETPSPAVPAPLVSADGYFQPVRISGEATIAPRFEGFTIDSAITPFGPNYSGGQQGRARSTMFFSYHSYYKTGEAKTWLNVAAPGPYAVCAKVNSYTINTFANYAAS
jgi:hypothetical protein